jgi:competence ComEA-like helix-hairpin-helix protein
MRSLSLIAFLSVVDASAQTKLPDSPRKAVFERMCTSCHGIESIVRARNSRERWGEVVDDMVSRGAQGTDDEIESVIDYLAANFSKTAAQKVNVNKAAAPDLASGLSISAKGAEAIVGFRTDHGPFKELEDLKKVPGIDTKKVDGWKDRVEYQ